MKLQVLDVGQVTAYIRDLLDTDPILSDVWLRGEVTSFFESNAGHCYFTLSGSNNQIKAVLFKGNRWGIAELPKQGDEVVAHGNVSIYPEQGQYQLYIDFLAPEGTGIAQLEFERLYRQLESEGLFDLSRKRPLPALPRRIGLVTSAQGAVLHDIRNVLNRRFPIVELVLSPSMVQGAEAPARLSEALMKLYESGRCDLIIIARGGGAPEELAAFNDEYLARTIFRAPVPVVSAIGHETDTTISDLVADLRAPTPSAAAELVVPDRREVVSTIVSRLEEARDMTGDRHVAAVDRLTRSFSNLRRQRPDRRIDLHSQSVDLLRLRSASAIRRDLERRRSIIESRSRQLGSLDPAAVLKRGFAVIDDPESGKRLGSIAAIRAQGTSFIVRMHDGDLRATAREEK